MAQWAALPTRQPGEVISSLDYRVDTTPAGRQHTVLFRHRDNRIWQGRIVNDPQTVGNHAYSYVAEVSCAGCRSWLFLSSLLDQCKRTISRFANLDLAMYQRLVADATSTSEFPLPGDVGVFRMRLIRQEQQHRGAAIVQSEMTGVARYDGGQIVVFPRSPELLAILSSVCASDTIAIVPTGINEIPGEDATPGFAVGYRQALQGIAPPQLDDTELHAAIGRLRDATAASVLSGLRAGEYTTTQRRYERDIDFFATEKDTAE